MTSYELDRFRKKIAKDPDNQNARRSFHERYEWLEGYWKEHFKKGAEIAQFSKKYESFYWYLDEFKDLTRRFSQYPPVGNSNSNFNPTVNVERATYFLRYHTDLFNGEFPDTDERDEKSIGLQWDNGRGPLEAILTIVKQVRDNLFHGRKMELEEPQYQRNKELVTLSAKIVLLILDHLIDAERSLR